MATADPEAFLRALRPGDIVLVEGNTRISTAIKYLTQSTWSHSSLCVGPISGRSEPSGEPHVLVEADVEHGVLSAPASKYSRAHTRICRPVGLSAEEIRVVTDFAVERIGLAYDLRNTFDLLRYLLPNPPVPSRFPTQDDRVRRRLAHSGDLFDAHRASLPDNRLSNSAAHRGYRVRASRHGFCGLGRGVRTRAHSALFAVRAARLRHFSLFHGGKADDRGLLQSSLGQVGL